MTNETQPLKPGEIIHNGEVKNATCATCCYYLTTREGGKACAHSSGLVSTGCNHPYPEWFCDKHPLRDPQVRIAEAVEKIATTAHWMEQKQGMPFNA